MAARKRTIALRLLPKPDTCILCLNDHAHLRISNTGHDLLEYCRWRAQSIPVSEEQDALALSLCRGTWLHPLTHARTLPHALQEAHTSAFDVGAVVATHDGLDGFGGLVGVVEGDGADVVVQDMSLDNAVQQSAADEAKLTVDGGSGAADVGPGLAVVVRKGRVSVLEEGDGNWKRMSARCFWSHSN